MSVNSSQILHDAKLLVTRLQDRDKMTDKLLQDAQTVTDKINCLKQYKDDLGDLHDSRITQRPRSVLVHNLQQENRQIKILQDENRQLKLALEEHQATLDVIMQRYRQQVVEMIKLNRLQQIADKAVHGVNQNNNFADESFKLVEFARLFDQCLKGGEEASTKDQEELTRLKTENQTLRQLLKIATQNIEPFALASPTTPDAASSAAAKETTKIDDQESSRLPAENATVQKPKEAAPVAGASVREKTCNNVASKSSTVGKTGVEKSSTPSSKPNNSLVVNGNNNNNNNHNPNTATTTVIKPPPRSSSATKRASLPQVVTTTTPTTSATSATTTTTTNSGVKKSSSQDSTLSNGIVGVAPSIGTPLTITATTSKTPTTRKKSSETTSAKSAVGKQTTTANKSAGVVNKNATSSTKNAR